MTKAAKKAVVRLATKADTNEGHLVSAADYLEYALVEIEEARTELDEVYGELVDEKEQNEMADEAYIKACQAIAKVRKDVDLALSCLSWAGIKAPEKERAS